MVVSSCGQFRRERGRIREGTRAKEKKRKEKNRKGGGKEDERKKERKKAEERGARVCPRTSLRLKFESRRFLSRRNESPCTRAAKVPGSRAETPSYYFYGPETSAGIIIISPGRGRARSSAPSAGPPPLRSLRHPHCRRCCLLSSLLPYPVSLHSFSFGRSLSVSLLAVPRATIASPPLSSRRGSK